MSNPSSPGAQQASCRFLSDHVQKIAAHERSMVATPRGKNETDHEQQHKAQNAPRARRSHSIRRTLLVLLHQHALPPSGIDITAVFPAEG